MNDQQLSDILNAQQKVIEQIVLRRDLAECLSTICLAIEGILTLPDARSSVLILQDNQLFKGAAPHIDPAFSDAINGVTIGPAVGSCGTAAYTGEQVIVSDIEHDPLWTNYKDLALAAGLKACWSTPIKSTRGDVLGSFAIYYTRRESPSPDDLAIIDRFTHLASLALEKQQALDRERSLNRQLASFTEKFKAFTSVMPDLGLVIDEQGYYVDVYGGDPELLYSRANRIIGQHLSDGIPAEKASEFMEVIERTLLTDSIQIIEYDLFVLKGNRTFEGRVAPLNHYLLDAPEKRHVLWMARDITERKQASAKIERLAFYDPLTQLPNRRLLANRLQKCIQSARRDHRLGALLFIDLDDFKRINDSLGHSVGDELLMQVAARMKPMLREKDTLARIGGDEFVVILGDLQNHLESVSAEAATVAQKLLNCLSTTFRLHGNEYKIGASIGVALIDDQNLTADEVLKRADSAMYRAKTQGRNRFAYYDPSLQEAIDQRLRIEGEIAEAALSGQFCAYFQPQLNTAGQVIGAEALIRWNHPQQGTISPAHFIPVAEQCGLIGLLQAIVIEQSCKLLLQLGAQNLLPKQFALAINISPGYLNRSLQEDLVRLTGKFGIQPRMLKLEITEGMLMENLEETIALMRELKAEGFRFAVDDFGTGYSSLAYLHRFPIDELKIDASFVEQLSNQPENAIIDAIIAMSAKLGFQTIAEGVETSLQQDRLTVRQVNGLQGFLFTRPLPAAEFVEWLKRKDTSAHPHFDYQI